MLLVAAAVAAAAAAPAEPASVAPPVLEVTSDSGAPIENDAWVTVSWSGVDSR